MKICILVALVPIVAGGVNAWGVKNLWACDSKDDGKWHPDARIISGSEAIKDRFSYVILLQNGPHFFCGGSLIVRDIDPLCGIGET